MPLKLKRRSVLKGLAGVALPLPLLEAMGQTAAEETPKRFCGLYIANGMALPDPKHGIDEWSWFPRAAEDGKFVPTTPKKILPPTRSKSSTQVKTSRESHLSTRLVHHPEEPAVRSKQRRSQLKVAGE